MKAYDISYQFKAKKVLKKSKYFIFSGKTFLVAIKNVILGNIRPIQTKEVLNKSFCTSFNFAAIRTFILFLLSRTTVTAEALLFSFK